MSKASTPTALFEVPFSSSMGDTDLALLVRRLDLSTHPKQLPGHTSVGFTRLDHHSGLFLERGSAEGQWALRARTWDHPARQSVQEWHVLAADAARRLDPTVVAPDRLTPTAAATLDRTVGRAQNKRLSRIRRRLCGVE